MWSEAVGCYRRFMEEKEKDLIHSKRKDLINKILGELSEEHRDLYYLPTVEISAMIQERVTSNKLNQEEKELLEGLSLQDIQVLLSHHDHNGRV